VNARGRFSGAALALALVSGLVRADQGSPPSDEAPADVTASSLQKEQASLRTELDLLSARGQETQKRLLARGRALYRLARVGILPVGGGLDALFEHAGRVERTRRALDQDMADSRAIADRKVTLLRKLGEVSSRQAKLDAEREGLLLASRALDDRLDGVRPSRGEPQNAFEGVALSSSRDMRANPDAVPAVDAAEGFRAMKGRLPLPLALRTEVRRVRRPGASGPGVEMSAPPGTSVRAVFPGRVAFADRYDSFGTVVILDHGDHFYTLMGDLGSMDVRVGDDLSAGARIGTVGERRSEVDNGGRRSSVLYFEIRRGASTLDPGPWLGL
jgi:murein DD-endopeptidase MepM/ murein hydrolase activator NlpD